MLVDPWVGKIPWRRKWQPTPVFLPGKNTGVGLDCSSNSWTFLFTQCFMFSPPTVEDRFTLLKSTFNYISVLVQQKPTQHCKTIFPQLKIGKKLIASIFCSLNCLRIYLHISYDNYILLCTALICMLIITLILGNPFWRRTCLSVHF